MTEINRNNSMLIPKRITIETVYGCNARCIMCPISLPALRKKGIMPMDLFQYAIDSVVEHQANIEMIDLCGLGEPLLDPYLFDRIKYVKKRGFRNIGTSTNAHLLNAKRQKLLLESGIDNLIISIDGATKETHEKIRRRTDFDRIVTNCLNIIQIRNRKNFSTRFVFRFIRQHENQNEWELFKEFWRKKISREKGDFITVFDAHTHGGEISNKETSVAADFRDPIIEKNICYLLFEILYILVDGTVPLCSEDWYQAKYNFGNIKNNQPIEIFNSDKFNRIRKIHLAGKKSLLGKCKHCTIHYSALTKDIVKPD